MKRRWVFGIALAVGCGPIEYVSTVRFAASQAVQEAKAAGAAELAPYEYTSAVEYLQMAKEAGGYSRYQEAIEWGKKARDFGREAAERARERGKR